MECMNKFPITYSSPGRHRTQYIQLFPSSLGVTYHWIWLCLTSYIPLQSFIFSPLLNGWIQNMLDPMLHLTAELPYMVRSFRGTQGGQQVFILFYFCLFNNINLKAIWCLRPYLGPLCERLCPSAHPSWHHLGCSFSSVPLIHVPGCHADYRAGGCRDRHITRIGGRRRRRRG